MHDKSRVIVVLGVHRSGAGVLAGALDLLGVNLGRRFLHDNEGNGRHRFELTEVVRINDELLRLSGKVWDCIELPPYADLAAHTGPLIAAAQKFLAEEFGETALWGLKDPRMCRFLPFWQQLFAKHGATDAYVLVLRNPLNVARSLEQRDGFATEKSCLLWLSHMRAALAGIRGRRAVVVDYDTFIEAPANELERVAAQLGLAVPPDVKAGLAERCAQLVDPALRHARIDEVTMYADPRVPDTVKDLHRALKLCARELAALPSLAERTARAERGGADNPWLARVVPLLEDEIVRARDDLAKLAAQVAEAHRQHASRDDTETALRALAAGAERDLADERVTIASLAQQLDSARESAQAHLDEIAAARANIEAVVAELEAARANAELQEQQLEAARAHIELLDDEIARTRSIAESRQREIERLAASLEASSRDMAEREQREATLRNDVVRLDEETLTLRKERDGLVPALRQAQDVAGAVGADRDRLLLLERSARERGALLDGRITALESELAVLRARGEVDAMELAGLTRSWYGRLARRLARRAARSRSRP